jgi:hypothetical protein
MNVATVHSFEAILAVAEGDSGGMAVGFYWVQLDRFPQAAINRRVGELITVMEIDQMVRPHRTLLRGVIERGDFLKVFALVGEQGIIKRERLLASSGCRTDAAIRPDGLGGRRLRQKGARLRGA